MVISHAKLLIFITTILSISLTFFSVYANLEGMYAYKVLSSQFFYFPLMA